MRWQLGMLKLPHFSANYLTGGSVSAYAARVNSMWRSLPSNSAVVDMPAPVAAQSMDLCMLRWRKYWGRSESSARKQVARGSRVVCDRSVVGYFEFSPLPDRSISSGRFYGNVRIVV